MSEAEKAVSVKKKVKKTIPVVPDKPKAKRVVRTEVKKKPVAKAGSIAKATKTPASKSVAKTKTSVTKVVSKAKTTKTKAVAKKTVVANLSKKPIATAGSKKVSEKKTSSKMGASKVSEKISKKPSSKNQKSKRSKSASRPKQSTPVFIYLVMGLLVLLLAGGGFLYMNGGDSKSTSAPTVEEVTSTKVSKDNDKEVDDFDYGDWEPTNVVKEYKDKSEAPDTAILYQNKKTGIYIDLNGAHPMVKNRYMKNKNVWRAVSR